MDDKSADLPQYTTWYLASPSIYIPLLFFTIFIFTNLKNLPMVWNFRLLTFLLQSRSWRSPQHAPDTTIFQPLVMRTRSPLLETDLYLHKNNATYISDIDIARWHSIMALFLPVIRSGPSPSKASSGAPTSDPITNDPTTTTSGATTSIKPRGMLQVILGQVSCTFKREIKPYEPYEIWTRVLTWDDKWMYFVTHFVRADNVPKRGWGLQPWKAGGKRLASKGGDAAIGKPPSEKALLASALSQCVFKDGRVTVRPEVVVREAGLLGGGKGEAGGEGVWDAEQVELERLRGLKVVEATAKEAGGLHALFEPAGGVVLGEYKDVWAWVPFLR